MNTNTGLVNMYVVILDGNILSIRNKSLRLKRSAKTINLHLDAARRGIVLMKVIVNNKKIGVCL